MTAFHVFLRAVLERAGREAQGERSAMVEAQHVLLAMASPSDAESRELLESLGLDRRALRAALDSEFRQALSAAGVSLEASEPQRADCTNSSAPPLGTSVRHALERGLGSMRDAPRPAHLLLGILQAEVGTVPRALELAGLDRATLIARVRATLQAG
jgi:ATP-dependent Clp protease ATP-binding subunit ClpA